MNTLKYLTKIFKTSPGKFSKRETNLIRHFLKINKHISTNVGLETLKKALNASDNNIKWILKVFLVANVQDKKKKSLSSVVSTINGKVFKRKKLEFKLSGGKATIIPKYSKHRFVMFPDRAGEGSTHIFQVNKLKKPRIPKDKTTAKQLRRYARLRKQQKQIREKRERDIIKKETKLLLKMLKNFIAPLDSIEDIILSIEELNDLVDPNKSSLDIQVSGDWFERVSHTTKKRGETLRVEFYKRDINDEWESWKYTYTEADSETPADLMWVFDAYKIVAPELVNKMKMLGNKKMQGLKTEVDLVRAECRTYRAFINKFCNTRFVEGSYHGTNMGLDVIASGFQLIEKLKELHSKFLKIGEPPTSVTPITKEELFSQFEDNAILTDFDIENFGNNG